MEGTRNFAGALTRAGEMGGIGLMLKSMFSVSGNNIPVSQSVINPYINVKDREAVPGHNYVSQCS